jgi:hypothetical protein
MSGSSIPYHLRPHKAVDRRLFVDLLVRCERWRSLADAAYISMGAYPLEDHKLIHRILGIRKLIAFDYEAEIVKRQIFNRPIDTCQCICHSSGELIDNLDTILSDVGYADAKNLIVWLDYTSPATLGEQIREFVMLLDKLKDGDIVRITVNANASSLFTAKPQKGEPTMPAEEVRKIRYEKLNERIGDYLATDTTAEMMTDEKLPPVLGRAFGAAALQALPTSGANAFAPLSIVRYADGQQMLSLTGVVVPREQEIEMRERLELASWRFASKDWSDVHLLTVPDLTIRERLFLERAIGTTSIPDLKDQLGFDFAELDVGEAFLGDYEHYYRFYPNLLAAEI